MRKKKNKSKKIEAKGIKEKLEKLISSLLDDALADEITLESLATKTAIAKTAIDYLKISKKEEDEGTWFKEEFKDKDFLQEELAEARTEFENLEENEE